jgi:putative membrane protein
MTGGAVTALLFFIVYLSRTVLVGNTSWGGPDWLKPYYLIFLLFHIVLATVAAVFGITTLLLAWNKKFAKHRRWGRITATIWLPTAVTGVFVYVLLYWMYPGGHTKPVFEAIFG